MDMKIDICTPLVAAVKHVIFECCCVARFHSWFRQLNSIDLSAFNALPASKEQKAWPQQLSLSFFAFF